jgi:hypothetical protein
MISCCLSPSVCGICDFLLDIFQQAVTQLYQTTAREDREKEKRAGKDVRARLRYFELLAKVELKLEGEALSGK